MKTVLQNGQLLIDGQLQSRDIVIEDQKITAIVSRGTQQDGQLIDLTNSLVTPGLIDVHVHLREPGFTNKETIKTGSQAAAHGGFTTIGAMANLKPTPDTPDQLDQQLELNKQGVVKIAQYAPVTQQRQGNALNDYAALKQHGAFAFSDDGSGIENALVMYQAMQALAQIDGILCDHAQDMTLTQGGVINTGKTADKFHVPGNPGVSETAQIARNLVLAQDTGVHYHVCHVSTKASVDLVRAAKERGINVTCEVAPHHLLLDDSMIETDDGNYKMNPPLRSPEDRQACLVGLMDGTIDMIATDHAPHTDAEKNQGLLTSQNGIVGSENAFALLYTHFVKPGFWTLAQLIDWMSTQPQRLFNLQNAGQLQVGQPADIAVFDLQKTEVIAAANFLSKGHNSPFIGQQVNAPTVLTMVDGQIVYRRDEHAK